MNKVNKEQIIKKIDSLIGLGVKVETCLITYEFYGEYTVDSINIYGQKDKFFLSIRGVVVELSKEDNNEIFNHIEQIYIKQNKGQKEKFDMQNYLNSDEVDCV